MINMKLDRNIEIYIDVVSGYSYAHIAKKYYVSRTRVMEIFWRIIQLLMNTVRALKDMPLPKIAQVREDKIQWIAYSNKLKEAG